MPFQIRRIKPKSDLRGLRILAYGESGKGKTTFWARMQKIDPTLGAGLWLPFESGQEFQGPDLELDAFPIPRDSTEYRAMVAQYLKELSTKYPYLVIDGLGYAYQAEKMKAGATKAGSFGKDKPVTQEEYRVMLETFKSKGAGLIALAHNKYGASQENQEKQVVFPDFENKEPADKIIGLFDLVLYFYIDQMGRYRIRTKGDPNVLTKDRTQTLGHGGLPSVMEMDPKIFVSALKKAMGMNEVKGK